MRVTGSAQRLALYAAQALARETELTRSHHTGGLGCVKGRLAPSIGKNGLSLTCTYSPNVADNYGIKQNYTCGAVQGDDPSSAPAGYDFFGWKPGLGQEWALQARMRLPYNTGEANPGWWSDGLPWNQEIDMLEGFGL